MRKFEKISLKQWLKDTQSIMSADECLRIYETIQVPQKKTKKACGYDMLSPFNFELKPNEDIKIPTGIRVILNDNEFCTAYPRSGLGTKFYIRLANTIGVIDADYSESDNEGHIWIKIRNEGTKEIAIGAGEGFCQLILQQYLDVDDLDRDNLEQRNGGFGSTDKKC